MEPSPNSILVVEDTPAARKLAERMLTSLGYDVSVASNADEAIGLFNLGNRYCVLFTDVIMPGTMDGIGLAKIARTYDKNMQVIFTSGFSSMEPDDLVALRAIYITKPYRKSEIAAVLESVFKRTAQ
jgi:CheY-like chemotaxis protein